VKSFVQLVGPNGTVQLLGVRLVGVNAETGKKLIFSLLFLLAVYLTGKLLRRILRAESQNARSKRIAFWSRQGISIGLGILLLVGLVSLWFDNPATLTSAAGMLTAGLAFALQRVITAFAGYLVILRGNTFTIGDRITMGGIRGDVVSLKFLQTVIMEMGQPEEGEAGDSAWVHSRQYTGRLVHVSNANIFDDPVYNYTHEFPYIWEEIRLPVPYTANRARAEEILLGAAQKHTTSVAQLSAEALKELERRYVMERSEIHPEVYWRLTDNWIEMTVRFIVPVAGIRKIKSDMSRDILQAFDEAQISIASGTYEVVGMPPLKVQVVSGRDGT
jgi:small-conductance mechanosensitive channel